jgi:hypothetical protein
MIIYICVFSMEGYLFHKGADIQRDADRSMKMSVIVTPRNTPQMANYQEILISTYYCIWTILI